ncbi:hypothetical protein [Candidatus Sororendozoicomonas aggregata]|uniref:hypothetical protein n=1 Tax=Candidatus Sororendozoicomonas aggregata TaxID=3073239 RepID=UPI002ED61C57
MYINIEHSDKITGKNKEETYAYLCNSATSSLLKSSLPSIKKFLDIDDDNVFFEYLRWLYCRNLPSDWRIGSTILAYLREMKLEISHELEVQCLLSTCSQWTYFDKTQKRIIAIQEKNHPKNIICGEKSSQARLEREVFYFSMESSLKTNYQYNYWLLDNESDLDQLEKINGSKLL